MSLSSAFITSCIGQEAFKPIPNFIYHLSVKDVGDTLTTKTTKTKESKIAPSHFASESDINRFCVSNSIEGCIIALIGYMDPRSPMVSFWTNSTDVIPDPYDFEFYVYGCDASNLPSDTYVPNERILVNKLVWDAPVTGEAWILKPTIFHKLGKIVVRRSSQTYKSLKFEPLYQVRGPGKYTKAYAYPYKFVEGADPANSSSEFTLDDIAEHFKYQKRIVTIVDPKYDDKDLQMLVDFYTHLKSIPYTTAHDKTIGSKTLLKEGGVCFDFVRYQAEWCEKHKLKYTAYFIASYSKTGNPCVYGESSHTFMLVELNKQIYWLEAAWGDHIGVFEFTDTIKALRFIRLQFWEHICDQVAHSFKETKLLNIPRIYTYNPLDKRYLGIGIYDFIAEVGGTDSYKGHGTLVKLPTQAFVPNIPDKKALIKI